MLRLWWHSCALKPRDGPLALSSQLTVVYPAETWHRTVLITIMTRKQILHYGSNYGLDAMIISLRGLVLSHL